MNVGMSDVGTRWMDSRSTWATTPELLDADNSCRHPSAALYSHLVGAHETLEVGSVDHATVNLELSEGIVDLGGGELVSEGHEGVSEGLSIDLAVDLEGLEGFEDGLIVIGTTGHLASEEGDHLGEVHGAGGFVKHGLGLTAADGLSVVAEGGDEVVGGEETILVNVHDAESFLELLDGRVGEGVENVGLLGHLDWLDLPVGDDTKVSADSLSLRSGLIV